MFHVEHGIIPTEDQEQITFIEWLNLKKILFFAIPNGGSRHLLEAIKLKKMGVRPGVPDIFIPIPNNNYHGLFIELKRKKGGKSSKNQLYWQSLLIDQGFSVHVAKGCDDAIKIVNSYLCK